MNDMTDQARVAQTSADLSAAAVPGRRRRPRRTLGVVAVAVVLALAGSLYIASPRRRVSTDDAYLKADETTVAPQIRGRVAEVLVRDNQPVRTGDPLVRIQADEFNARLALGAAELQNAEAGFETARAALLTLDAEERLARSNSRVVEATIVSARAQQSRAETDEARYARLAESGAASRRDAELSHTAAVGARAETERSVAALAASRDQEGYTRAKRAAALAALAQARATVARSRADIRLAQLDQEHAVIAAPVDGTVGALQVRVGDVVQPGTQLMSIVPLQHLYAIAYFKETQTAGMAAGQPARVELDALPGTTLDARVESLAPGTGSAFSFLPFEPGSGNFTKIVQRVPVRIRLDLPPSAPLPGLRPGLSATVTVDLRQ